MYLQVQCSKAYLNSALEYQSSTRRACPFPATAGEKGRGAGAVSERNWEIFPFRGVPRIWTAPLKRFEGCRSRARAEPANRFGDSGKKRSRKMCCARADKFRRGRKWRFKWRYRSECHDKYIFRYGMLQTTFVITGKFSETENFILSSAGGVSERCGRQQCRRGVRAVLALAVSETCQSGTAVS